MKGTLVKWSIQSISWQKFDPNLVDLSLLRLVKGASLVEYNSEDYVQYLRGVFADDFDFCARLHKWGEEERRHGEALAAWARLVDPTFDFESAFQRFRVLQPIEVGAKTSIRGSKSKELVARCVVETGTATYYSALADASQEPVLKEICQKIAADEIQHYTLFLKTLSSYADRESLSKWSRFKTVWERATEAEDEELTLAFACANYPNDEISRRDFKKYQREFMAIAYRLYQPQHIKKATRLVAVATGLAPHGLAARSLETVMDGAFFIRRRAFPK